MDLLVEHVDVWAASIQDKPGALATVLAELRELGRLAIHHCAACAGGARQGRRVRHAAAGRQGNRCGGTIGLQRHAHSPFCSSSWGQTGVASTPDVERPPYMAKAPISLRSSAAALVSIHTRNCSTPLHAKPTSSAS